MTHLQLPLAYLRRSELLLRRFRKKLFQDKFTRNGFANFSNIVTRQIDFKKTGCSQKSHKIFLFLENFQNILGKKKFHLVSQRAETGDEEKSFRGKIYQKLSSQKYKTEKFRT